MPLFLKICLLMLCACLTLTMPVTGGGIEGGIIEESPEIEPLGPTGDGTREEVVSGIRQMLANAEESCALMMESAEEKGAEARQLAEDARDQYAQRLTELGEMDYGDLSEAELGQYIDEISNIITAFREARDAMDEMQ